MKYIIKNCPAYTSKGDYYDCSYNKLSWCQNIDDCPLKQIINKIRNYEESCKIEGNCLDSRLCSTCFLGGANELGEWILDDLEIEEVK